MFREHLHFSEDSIYLEHDIVAIHMNRDVGAVSQGNVENRPVLGFVDPVSREHLFNGIRYPDLFGQDQKKFQCLSGNAILRVIDQDIAEPERKSIKTIRILVKKIPHVKVFYNLKMIV